MRARGVEPPRPEGHKDLNLARLPLPPPQEYCSKNLTRFDAIELLPKPDDTFSVLKD